MQEINAECIHFWNYLEKFSNPSVNVSSANYSRGSRALLGRLIEVQKDTRYVKGTNENVEGCAL